MPRQKEIENEEVNQFEAGFNQNTDETDAPFESTNSLFTDGKFDRADRSQEAYTRTGKADLPAPRMTRVDSAYQQVAFETGLLREAMISSQRKRRMRNKPNPMYRSPWTPRGGSLEDVDDGINLQRASHCCEEEVRSSATAGARNPWECCMSLKNQIVRQQCFIWMRLKMLPPEEVEGKGLVPGFQWSLFTGEITQRRNMCSNVDCTS